MLLPIRLRSVKHCARCVRNVYASKILTNLCWRRLINENDRPCIAGPSLLSSSSSRTISIYSTNRVYCSTASTAPDNPNLKLKAQREVLEEQKSFSWRQPSGQDTGIVLYNTLTRSKCPLILPNTDMLKWYVCGPTVYDEPHIGHACTYVRFDTIRRILSAMFHINVVYMMGITDIDDKIIRRSEVMEVTPSHLARKYESRFMQSMSRLNILPPTVVARVTEHIYPVISFIESLLEKNAAYISTYGDVYFSVDSAESYGCLSRCGLDKREKSKNSDKKNARDFVLWKAAKPGEPSWNSPWGQGRPGWHIECSALASHAFGENIDLHSGGEDLLFPHHENELAQSHVYHNCSQWVNYWIHTGSLHLSDDMQKMSKSLRNTITVDEMLKSYTANQFRLFCLTSSYRKRKEFDSVAMQKVIRMMSQLTSFKSMALSYIRDSNSPSGVGIDEVLLSQSLAVTQKAVKQFLADDFNTQRALKAVMNLVHVSNIELCKQGKERSSMKSVGTVAAAVNYVDNIMNMFGINLTSGHVSSSSDVTQVNQKLSNVIDSTVSFRNKVRLFCLGGNTKGVSDEEKAAIKSHRKAHAVLLDDCDQLRKELTAHCNVSITDLTDRSVWGYADVTDDANLKNKFELNTKKIS